MTTLNLYVKIGLSYRLWNNQKNCLENWHLWNSYKILETLINAVIKDGKYVKVI